MTTSPHIFANLYSSGYLGCASKPSHETICPCSSTLIARAVGTGSQTVIQSQSHIYYAAFKPGPCIIHKNLF